MTEQELEVLLYRGESDMLDYKSAQYKFTGVGDADKVELLKDCLAFANSWRQEPGYILIGVKKNVGQPAQVVGIPQSDHLDDSRLQQFVNSKTNIPVRLLYEEVEYKGMSVGLIRFEYPQQRPVCLNRDFDRLKRDIVYIRRGSSTDECRPAEIAQMGAAVKPSKRLDFGFEFADPDTKTPLGTSLVIEPSLFDRPRWVDEAEPPQQGFWVPPQSILSRRQPTRAEKFDAVADILRFVPVCFRISNEGTGTAEDVEVHIDINAQEELELADEYDPPSRKYLDPIEQITPPTVRCNADVSPVAMGWELRLKCEKLHARQRVIFDPIHFACARETTITLSSTIFAHDLPEPIVRQLALSIKPHKRDYDAKLFRSLPFKR